MEYTICFGRQNTSPVDLETLFAHGDRKTIFKSIWNFKVFEKYFWKYFWKIFGTENFKNVVEISRFSKIFEKFENLKNFQFKSSYKIFGFSIFRKFSKMFSKIFFEYFKISDRLQIGFAISVVKNCISMHSRGVLGVKTNMRVHCFYAGWIA